MRAQRGRSIGRRAERGATLVEYSLILAVVVVVAVGAIQYMSDRGSDEVVSEADCVSTRPPPESCQRAAVTTVTTVTPSSTTSTVAPTSTITTTSTTSTTTTSTTTTTAPPTTTTTAPPTTTTTTAPPTTTTTTRPPTTTTTTQPEPPFDGRAQWTDDDSFGFYYWGWLYAWYGEADLRIRDDRNRNVRNAEVVISWEVTGGSPDESGTVTCTTNRSGRCTVRIPASGSYLDPRVSEVTLTIETIDGQPAPSGTDELELDRP